MKKITAMIMALTMAFAMASCSGSASSGTTSGEDGSAAQVDSSQTGQTSMEFDENATEDPQVSDVEILNKADKYLKGIVTIPAMAKYEKSVNSKGIRYRWLATTKRPRQPMQTVITKGDYTIKGGTPIIQVEADGYVIRDDQVTVQSKALQGTFGAYNESTGINLSLYAYNSSKTTQAIKDCVVGGVSFTDDIDGVDYQGITKDTKLSEMIEKFGIPSGGFEITTHKGVNEATINLYYGTPPEEETAEFRFKYASDDDVSLYKIEVRSMGRF